ncbi:MAG: hypothetical protein D3924_20775, partial [Candidatus Electrothrix sp. AR4]|nr:hypothetical protein [Candidatus Electrothrix sp. AR4]
INSAIILALLTLLLYLTSSNPEATVWSSMGLIIITVLKSLQWGIAMSIGLLVCLLVLFAIFFGAMALFDRALSLQMYEGLRETLLAWFLPVKEQCDSLVNSARQQENASCSAEGDQEGNGKLNNEIKLIESQLHTTREVLTSKIEQLSSRIDDLEKMTDEVVNNKELEALSDEVRGAVDSLAGIQGAVDTMQNCVEQTVEQMKEISPHAILNDLPERVQTLEQQQTGQQDDVVDIAPLEKDIACMRSELAQVKEKAGKALQAAADNVPESPVQEEQTTAARQPESNDQPESIEEEHRIFSYFDDSADKKKIAELVTSSLRKDMTYKQVINFIVKDLGSAKGK